MNVKEYDFVFIYEGKSRELESNCLIRQELEWRGYKVEFVNVSDGLLYKRRPPHANVAIAYCLYNDRNIGEHLNRVQGCRKIVNMQWEQVSSNGTVALSKNGTGDSNSIGVYGLAKEAAHISWGENNYQTLTELYNVTPTHVRITGHVALDFLRPEFRNYYLSREEVLKRYKIPVDKKICIFISSLSFVNMPEKSLNDEIYANFGFDIFEYKRMSTQTQKEIVEWAEKMLAQRDDCIFIYRPHPAENNSALLAEAEKRCPNFMVIDELSVKQWILAADQVYTWASTSIAEILAAGKTCGVLRPVSVPFEAEMEIYNNATFITDYETFLRSLDEKLEFPIPEAEFKEFYDIDSKVPTYIRICDYLEEVYKNDEYLMPVEEKKQTYSSLQALKHNLKTWLLKKYIFTEWMKKLLKIRYPERDIEELCESYRYPILLYERNHVTKKEIDTIMSRIRYVLAENNEIC